MSRLKPVLKSPNCVSSRAPSEDREHHVAPLAVPGDRDTAMERIKHLVLLMPRTRVQAEEPGYLHLVVTTRILRFKDDLELEWAEDGRIDVRSASRVGRSDLGANRKRVEALRSML
jgi:uncharacterized protein (DUF1499 family)